MPRPTKELQREYMRLWVAKRRATYFAGKQCAFCGSTEKLQLDHVDRSTKIDHKIWSWSKARREAEIAKCRILCEDCHTERHAKERRKPIIHGTRNAYISRHSPCRCQLCRAANVAYEKERKRRKRMAQQVG